MDVNLGRLAIAGFGLPGRLVPILILGICRRRIRGRIGRIGVLFNGLAA